MLLGSGLLLGCFGCAEQHPIAPHPAWISEVPGAKQEICAIGVSGPTYYAEDARANSKAAAMIELGRALEVTVKSQLLIQTSGDATSSDTTIRDMAGFSSEVVLKQSRVREQWVHPGDAVKDGPRGTVYTLMCVSIGP